jgi:type VI secretion system secreted protein Hcp
MAFDAFLKIDGIPGESGDSVYPETIEIRSYSHGLSQPRAAAVSTGGTINAERVDHADFSILKELDKATPLLALHCCTAKMIPSVVLTLCRQSGNKQKYMEYKFDNVTVTSVRPMGTAKGQEGLPMEEVTFAYNKITWTYTQLDRTTGAAKGNVSAGWDLGANKQA